MNTCKGVMSGFLIGILFFGMQCAKDPVASRGTGSTTETAMISGTIYDKNGSPAKNVSMYMQKKNYLANISTFLGKKSSNANMATAITDGNGEFLIDIIDTGAFVLEGSDGNNNLTLNDSVIIKCKDSTVHVRPDTLKPAGAIKGVIKLFNGGDPRKVFVLRME